MFNLWPNRARRQAGWRSCLHFGEPPGPRPPPCSTGIASLDTALGGGLPMGRIALLQGPPGVGKTDLCLGLAAHAQRLGHMVAWLDIDHTFDRHRARSAGLAAGTLMARCDDPAHALKLASALLSDRLVSFLVLDPWPPEPGDRPWRALRHFAWLVARTDAVVLAARGRLAKSPVHYDAMRQTSSTVMLLANDFQEAPPADASPGRASPYVVRRGATGVRPRGSAGFLYPAMRIIVSKQPGRQPRAVFPTATFAGPANNWPHT